LLFYQKPTYVAIPQQNVLRHPGESLLDTQELDA
jgi:hypothetical protein